MILELPKIKSLTVSTVSPTCFDLFLTLETGELSTLKMFTRLKGVKLPVWVSVTFLALWEDLEVSPSPVGGEFPVYVQVVEMCPEYAWAGSWATWPGGYFVGLCQERWGSEPGFFFSVKQGMGGGSHLACEEEQMW